MANPKLTFQPVELTRLQETALLERTRKLLEGGSPPEGVEVFGSRFSPGPTYIITFTDMVIQVQFGIADNYIGLYLRPGENVNSALQSLTEI